MGGLTLTTHDPDEDFDDTPSSLIPLRAWLAAHQEGAAPFSPDVYEGVGLLLDDGVHRWLAPSFGDARSLAYNLRSAAERLDASRVALLRTAVLDQGTYVFLVPTDGFVEVVEVLDAPPCGRAFPYRPSRQPPSDDTLHALNEWAEVQAAAYLAPSRNPALDRARGRGLAFPIAELTVQLLEEAEIAWRVAEAIGCPRLPGEGEWDPLPPGALRAARHMPAAPPGPVVRVRVTGLRDAYHKGDLLRLFRTHGAPALADAKELLASAARGEGFDLELPLDQADAALETLSRAGAMAQRAPRGV